MWADSQQIEEMMNSEWEEWEELEFEQKTEFIDNWEFTNNEGVRNKLSEIFGENSCNLFKQCSCPSDSADQKDYSAHLKIVKISEAYFDLNPILQKKITWQKNTFFVDLNDLYSNNRTYETAQTKELDENSQIDAFFKIPSYKKDNNYYLGIVSKIICVLVENFRIFEKMQKVLKML